MIINLNGNDNNNIQVGEEPIEEEQNEKKKNQLKDVVYLLVLRSTNIITKYQSIDSVNVGTIDRLLLVIGFILLN